MLERNLEQFRTVRGYLAVCACNFMAFDYLSGGVSSLARTWGLVGYLWRPCIHNVIIKSIICVNIR